MAGLSNFQSVFRVAKHEQANGVGQSRAAKRFRQPVSCTACRNRKLKCDRQIPCTSCSKRGDEASCTFANAGGRQRDEAKRTSEAQARLQKLEEMVTNLISQGSGVGEKTRQNGHETSHETSQETSQEHSMNDIDHRDASISSATGLTSGDEQPRMTSGHIDVSGPEKRYVGSSNWAAILDDIRDIRGVLDPAIEASQDSFDMTSSMEPDVLIDTAQQITLLDVFESLPPRQECDRLLSVYFNTKDIAVPILHSEKFSREYAAFWTNPSSVSFLWISMLFSVLHVGFRIVQRTEQSHDLTIPLDVDPPYMLRAGQALVTGRYHKALPYSCEALLLFGLSKLLGKEDPDMDAWMLIGNSVRLSMKMGYHRDPKYLPTVSPFEGEMRRRTFYIMGIFDLLISFQAGMPSIIHEEEIDVEDPKNLFDSDFDEDSKVIPPSRPYTDHTPMLYHCYKGRLGKAFRRVARLVLSHKRPSYDQIMSLDKELRVVHAEIPPVLRMRPLRSSVTDQPYTILHRLHVDLMYNKCLCILHRAYLTEDRLNPTFDYSRKTCVDAALIMLDHQTDLHDACQPGGIFAGNKWSPSSLTQQEFMLAAMIVSLDLHESPKDAPNRDQKMGALKLANAIWYTRRSLSREALRASNVLGVMLSKASEPCDLYGSMAPPVSALRAFNMSNTSDFDALQTTSASDSLTSSASPETPVDGIEGPQFVSQPDFTDSSFSSLFEGYDEFDWSLVDQYLFNPSDKTTQMPDQAMQSLDTTEYQF
ncbi:MAG: hypothetical protein M1828_001200 [Chrysothrix sp. TS-e1954]|nr:MAG: hypothetical protein M1828_001200 [Chrysothrix sp. TS-e1954]